MISGDYGFFDKLEKDQKFAYRKSLDIDYSKLVTTGMFPKAINHCAAVASTNLEIIHLGEASFEDHHGLIGNGPVVSFARKTRTILGDKGHKLSYVRTFAKKLSFVKSNIDEGRIVALLLYKGLAEWHWVLCTGYIILEDGNLVLEIFDNWNKRKRYYSPGKGSKIVSTTAYFLD